MIYEYTETEKLENGMFGACERNDVALMQACLDAGADASAVDRSKIPFTLLALSMGSCGVAALLFNHGAKIYDESWGFYEPEIIMACRKCCLDVIEILVKRGVNVDYVDSEGLTPMGYARMLMPVFPEEGRKMAKMLRDAGTGITNAV